MLEAFIEAATLCKDWDDAESYRNLSKVEVESWANELSASLYALLLKLAKTDPVLAEKFDEIMEIERDVTE